MQMKLTAQTLFVSKPASGEKLSAGVLCRILCAFAAAFLSLIFAGFDIPAYALIVGMAAVGAAYFGDRTEGRFAFLPLILLAAIPAAIAGSAVPSQAGRIFNALSDKWLVRRETLTPLLDTEGTSAAAICLFAALSGAVFCFAAVSRVKAVRLGLAAAAVLFAALFADEALSVMFAVGSALLAFSDEDFRAEPIARAVAVSVMTWALIVTGAAESISVRLVSGFGANNVCAGGKISQANGSLNVAFSAAGGSGISKDNAALEVSMEVPEAMYLHGFLGCRLVGDKWRGFELTEDRSLHTDMIYLSKSGTDAQTALYTLAKNSGCEMNRVTVRNIGADRGLLYLPVTSSDCSDFPAELNLPAHGRNTVTVETPLALSSLTDKLSHASAAPALSDESAVNCLDALYREEYLDIPDGIAHFLETRFPNAEQFDIGAAAKAAYDFCKGCELDNSAACSLAEFMQQTKKGSAAHFASAAVMIFRRYGIPARYAEGFALTRSLAAGKVGGSPITLTENELHAWAEYYLDGAGWLPFETIPYYLEEMPQPKGFGTNHVYAVGEELSGGDTGKPVNELSGTRPAMLIREEQPKDESPPAVPIIAVSAAVCLLTAAAVRHFLYVKKLKADPCRVLSECAAILGKSCDTAGNYDFSDCPPDLKKELDGLQAACLNSVYGGGEISCEPYSILKHCKKSV